MPAAGQLGPRKEPMVKKNLSIPKALADRIDAHLFSEVEGKVPYGAWQQLLLPLLASLARKLDRKEALANPDKFAYLDEELARFEASPSESNVVHTEAQHSGNHSTTTSASGDAADTRHWTGHVDVERADSQADPGTAASS